MCPGKRIVSQLPGEARTFRPVSIQSPSRALKAAVLASWAKNNILERCTDARLRLGVSLLAWFSRREKTLDYSYHRRLRMLPDERLCE